MAKGDFPASEFWDFSLATYGRPGVASACIALQDRRGADVNLLLLCCWLGASGRGRVEADELDRALAVSRPWQEAVVAPLRRLRRRLKSRPAAAPGASVEAVRRGIAAAEIDAEHAEQLMIAAAVPRAPKNDRPASRRLADAAENVARYLAALGVAAAAADRADLATLLAGAFPALDRAEAAAHLTTTLCGRG